MPHWRKGTRLENTLTFVILLLKSCPNQFNTGTHGKKNASHLKGTALILIFHSLGTHTSPANPKHTLTSILFGGGPGRPLSFSHYQTTTRKKASPQHLENSQDSWHTWAGPVRHKHVPVETVALEAAVSVHAPVLAGTRLQATLVQIWKERKSKQNNHETSVQT